MQFNCNKKKKKRRLSEVIKFVKTFKIYNSKSTKNYAKLIR